MNNTQIVGITAFVYAFINQMALSLGITTSAIEYPDGLTDIGTTSILEVLATLPIWLINNLWSFLQLAFFTADIPIIFQSLFFSPILMMFLFMFIMGVRGASS